MPNLPRSTSGKWAVGLGIVFEVAMVISLLIAFAIGGDPNAVAGNPFIAVLNLTLNLAALLSLVLGVFTMIKHKEWAVAVYLAIAYGIGVIMFLLGEFLFPH